MYFKYVATLRLHKKKAAISGRISHSLRAFHNIQLVQFIVSATSIKYSYLFYLKTFLRSILNTCFNIVFNPAINSKNGLPNGNPKYSTITNHSPLDLTALTIGKCGVTVNPRFQQLTHLPHLENNIYFPSKSKIVIFTLFLVPVIKYNFRKI